MCKPDPTPPLCEVTGQILVKVNTGFCYTVTECKCSDDKEYFRIVCPAYNQSLPLLTPEKEIKETPPPSSSDECCPTYEVVCKPCKVPKSNCSEGYVPQVTADPGSECNCTIITCLCTSCVDGDTHYDVGHTISETDDQNCVNNKTCTNHRTHPGQCFEWDFTYHQNLTCKTNEQFEATDCTEYEIASLLPSPGCCDVFECVCNYELCESPTTQPTVDAFHKLVPYTVNENPNQQCCPKWHVVCLGCIVEVNGTKTLKLVSLTSTGYQIYGLLINL